jgi:hypothetical protein
MVLSFAAIASAQGLRYDNIAFTTKNTAYGKIMLPAASANVAVCTQPAVTGSTPCTPLATLYTDSTLTIACNGSNGCSNPTSADSNGNFHFYYNPVDGPFTLQYYGSTISTYVTEDQGQNPAGSFKSVNGLIFADQYPGADACAQINAAFVAAHTNYTPVMVTPGIKSGCSMNPYSGITWRTTLIIMPDVVLTPSLPIQISSDQTFIYGLKPTGYPGGAANAVEGSVIQPTASFSGSAVMNFEVPSNYNMSDVGISGITFDMINVPMQTVLRLATVSGASVRDCSFTNSDGTRILLERAAAASTGTLINEHITIERMQSWGYSVSPTYATQTGSIVVDGYSGQINILDSFIQGRSGAATNSVGVLLEGANVDSNILNNSFGGFEKGIVIQNKGGHTIAQDDGTPIEARIQGNFFETFNQGISIQGTTGNRADFELVKDNRFETPTGTNPYFVYFGPYTEWSTLVQFYSAFISPSVYLDTNAVVNYVFMQGANSSAISNNNVSNTIAGFTSDGFGNFFIEKLRLGPVTFSNLGAPDNGTVYYCSDCTVSATCAGSGNGAIAKILNGVWVCN